MQNGALLDRETLAAVVLRVVATDEAPENHRHQSSVPVSKPITSLSIPPTILSLSLSLSDFSLSDFEYVHIFHMKLIPNLEILKVIFFKCI